MKFSETNGTENDPRSAKTAAVMQYDVPFLRNSSAIWNILSTAQTAPSKSPPSERHLLTQNEKHSMCNDFSVSFIHALGVVRITVISFVLHTGVIDEQTLQISMFSYGRMVLLRSPFTVDE